MPEKRPEILSSEPHSKHLYNTSSIHNVTEIESRKTGACTAKSTTGCAIIFYLEDPLSNPKTEVADHPHLLVLEIT